MSGDLDRIKGNLAAFIRAVFPRLKYFGAFPAKVVSQNADGTLELQPDDPEVPAQSAVPIRLGIPGCKVKVAAGARVLLSFAGGDPKAPISTLWESGSVTELDLDGTSIVLNGGTHAVGRVGDAVSPTAAMTTWITQVATAINILAPLSVSPPIPTSFGSISAGAPGVKA